MSKRIPDRSSAIIPTAVLVVTGLAGSKTWTDTCAMSIDQRKRRPLDLPAHSATVVQNSLGATIGLNTFGNITSNLPNNQINIPSPSEPDPASHWIKSDVSPTASFDEYRMTSFAPLKFPEMLTPHYAPDEYRIIWDTEAELSRVIIIDAFSSNEPNTVIGNHWRREAIVSRHMDSSRSKYRISQVMASLNTSKRAVLPHEAPRSPSSALLMLTIQADASL